MSEAIPYAVVVVQARVGSTRLPGKVLMKLDGRTMLRFLLDRIAGLAYPVVVATSDQPRDDAVDREVRAAGVRVVRGSEQDVLDRFRLALEEVPAVNVVRLTADCPLMDPEVVAAAIARHHESSADYTSNTIVRTWPDGLDVEVVSARAIREAAEESGDRAEREHVTPFVYRRPERYSLAKIAHSGVDVSRERWTVDTAEDLASIRDVVARLDEGFGWRDVLSATGFRATPAADEIVLTTALSSSPSRRQWDVMRAGSVLGRVEVVIRDVGRGQLEVHGVRIADVLGPVRRALSVDAQVVDLEVVAR